MALDLVTATRRELAAHSSVTALLGSDARFSTWIFRWRPYVSIEGTGEASIVVSSRAGWSTANRHNTAKFPRLQIEIYADLARNNDLNPAGRTAEDLARQVFEAVDKVLHRVDSNNIQWGNTDGKLRIHSSVRSQEPTVEDVPNGDGLVRSLVFYDVAID